MEYIRTDKNGTMYYADYTCPRCGGAGGASKWQFTGWSCYECGGSGKRHKPQIIKKYTPEYEKKLEARREAAALKRLEKERAQFKANKIQEMQKLGFSADGFIWVVKGNTYEIKDELKAEGAKWVGFLYAWTFDKETKHETKKYSASDLLEEKDTSYEWSSEKYNKLLELEKEKEPDDTISQFRGNEGEKINELIAVAAVIRYERPALRGWGTELASIYKFRDTNGNILIWNTTSWKNIKEGDKVKLQGTIKRHNVYKGVQQTELTRCKIESEAKE